MCCLTNFQQMIYFFDTACFLIHGRECKNKNACSCLPSNVTFVNLANYVDNVLKEKWYRILEGNLK